MRLREIDRIVKSANISEISLDGETSGPNTKRVKNLNAYRKAVSALEPIPAFAPYISPILSSSVFATVSDTFNIIDTEYYQLNAINLHLRFGAKALQESIREQMNEEQPESISIRLPDSRELRTVVSDLSTIEKVISQVITNPTIEGRVEVNTWEPGSLWIEIYLGSVAAVSLVGSIAWSATVIHKKRQEGKMFEEHVRGLSIKNESLENLLEAQKKLIADQIEFESVALYNEYFSADKKDPELTQRLQLAIKEFSKLIARGAEIHPALNAPEQVQNLFPSSINPLMIESRIQRIGDSENNQAPD